MIKKLPCLYINIYIHKNTILKEPHKLFGEVSDNHQNCMYIPVYKPTSASQQMTNKILFKYIMFI